MTPFRLTPKQTEAQALLGGQSTHTMLFGGSRSGKTFLLCRTVAVRALKAEGSRHLITRFRFNHVKASIWHDTWPKMIKLCFPDLVGKIKQDKTDWFQRFPNGSEIWFGGLDDKERVEKVLGNEYATVYLNECSQITVNAREILMTRLAQKTSLKLRALYDCNPPSAMHWTHRLFVEHKRPEPPYSPLPDPQNYAAMRINPSDNSDNLDADYLSSLQNLSARAKLRFYDGVFGSTNENALWTHEGIEKHRVSKHPDLQRVVVAIDPSGTHGTEDERSDHVGIVVAGLGIDGHAYILEDLTIKAAPHVWGRVAVTAYQRHNGDAIIGETNYGGAMVAHVVQSAASAMNVSLAYKEVTASRGKVVRAEPVSALYEQGRVHHHGTHAELEDQLCAFTTAGYTGDRSPDRGDACIWALTELFPGIVNRIEIDWNDKFSQNSWAANNHTGGWLRG